MKLLYLVADQHFMTAWAHFHMHPSCALLCWTFIRKTHHWKLDALARKSTFSWNELLLKSLSTVKQLKTTERADWKKYLLNHKTENNCSYFCSMQIIHFAFELCSCQKILKSSKATSNIFLSIFALRSADENEDVTAIQLSAVSISLEVMLRFDFRSDSVANTMHSTHWAKSIPFWLLQSCSFLSQAVSRSSAHLMIGSRRLSWRPNTRSGLHSGNWQNRKATASELCRGINWSWMLNQVQMICMLKSAILDTADLFFAWFYSSLLRTWQSKLNSKTIMTRNACKDSWGRNLSREPINPL